ncbi:Ig-like domain-containing protein, partial [Aliivibrio fischeri]|uniref:Ig-like domain-containing protein n=1 Tax=Aliivibrio fischeri TaxID=668 RepID=UPI000AE202E0
MALNISANKDQLIVIDKNGNLKLINAGDKVLPGEILLNSDNENISSDTNEAPELQKQDKDIEEVLNAIVDGEDPSLVSEASAAGEDNGSSLTTSVEIERTGQDFIAKTDFDTSPLEAIGFSKIQSLTLLEQYIAYRESGSINGETLNVVDTRAPNAPTIALHTDSGTLGDDLLTNDGSFTVTPSEAGNTIEYFVDGEWTIEEPIATEGNNSIVVRETDAAGNASGETSLDFVLDTQAPNAPTITLDTDSGMLDDDLLTNDGSFTVIPSEAGN